MYKIIGLILLIYFVSSKLLQNKKNLENLHVKNNILTEQLKKKELEIKEEKMKNAKLLENERIKEVENETKIQELEKDRDLLIKEVELVKQEENKILQSNRLSQLIYEYYYVGVGVLSLLLLFYLYGIFKIQSKTKKLSERQQILKQNQKSINLKEKTIKDEKNKTLVLNDRLQNQIGQAIKKKKDLQNYLQVHKQVSAQQTKKINQFLKNGTDISRKRVLNALNQIQRSNNPLGTKKTSTSYGGLFDDYDDYIFDSNNDNNNDTYYPNPWKLQYNQYNQNIKKNNQTQKNNSILLGKIKYNN